MQDWFSRNLPNSRTETPAPSEHSGWIMGGPSSLRIAFTDADLATFCAQWERLDGTRLDPRFQCGIYADVDWWRLHGHFMPTFTRPEGPEVSV